MPATLIRDKTARERQGGHVARMQRRRLILATAELLGEKGLERASVGRICERAGVSRRTFYELFEDRDDCVLAAFDAAVERIGGEVAAAYQREGTWCERVRGALTVLLDRLDADQCLARMCVVESLKAGPRVVERRARVLASLVAAVEAGRGGAKRAQPPPLTGQGVVGGALAVVYEHLRVSAAGAADAGADGGGPSAAPASLRQLAAPLMAMIVHPYLGAAAARRELERPGPKRANAAPAGARDPFGGLSIRLTYRTARVLATVAQTPGASNRLVGERAGIADGGQVSRLLHRLQRSGLIANRSEVRGKGEANAWALTERGEAINATLADGAALSVAPTG